MSSYQELNREFLRAIQQGTLKEFIISRNVNLVFDDYVAWWFLARAYAMSDQISHAKNAYLHLMRILAPDCADKNTIVAEVRAFANRTGSLDIPVPLEPNDNGSTHDNLSYENNHQAIEGSTPPVRKSTPSVDHSSTKKRIQDLRNDLKLDAALREINESLNIISNQKERLHLLYQAYEILWPRKDWENVIPVLAEIVKFAPNEKSLLHHSLLLARAYIQVGRVKDARKVINSVLSQFPQNEQALVLQASLSNVVPAAIPKVNSAAQDEEVNKGLTPSERYLSGERTYTTYLGYASELQHAQHYEKALEVLEEGLSAVPNAAKPYLTLLTLKAQILSSQQKWEDAATAYEELVEKDERVGANRTARLQLIQIYTRLNRIQDAKANIDTLLERNPQDQVALRSKSYLDTLSLSDGPLYSPEMIQELEQAKSPQLSRVELISHILLHDLRNAHYADNEILLKGSQPSLADAERLLSQANASKGSEFGERFPLFLEAAKAFNDLPEGSYPLEKFHLALTRYSMLKAGALVLEFRRAALRRADLQHLKRLRDSATSYYLESLIVQARVNVSLVIMQLTNYLRIQVAYILHEREEKIEDLFEKTFDEIFSYCIRHPDDALARIAYEIVVSSGAAGEHIWRKVAQQPGMGILYGSLEARTKYKRGRAYRILSEMSGRNYDITTRPGLVLEQSFFSRDDQTKQIRQFFGKLFQLNLTISNVRSVQKEWDSFPIYIGALMETDLELFDSAKSILATLAPYQTRTTEERTAILFTVRTQIEYLLDLIDKYPTYWGRTGFEPLLMKWKAAVTDIERQRTSELRPVLQVYLDPPTFHRENDKIIGGLLISNVGRATCEGFTIKIEILTYGDAVVWELEDNFIEEIPVKGNFYFPVDFYESILTQDMYKLRVEVAPIFRQHRLDGDHPSDFTLEISTEVGFQLEQIPWDELEIPNRRLFKGREQFIGELFNHLRSPDRKRTYILYGLTRTGKSSILRYLGDELDLKEVIINNITYRFVSFQWVLAEAASHENARDMWGYMIYNQMIRKLEQLVSENRLDASDLPLLGDKNNLRYKDLNEIITYLHSRALFPVFLVDEFSHYRQLVDKKRVDASFLASIRSYAIESRASFVFAGTYDLRDFIKDPKYGVTGQLVNVIEKKVSRIDEDPAIELIEVMNVLRFTPDAIEHILNLSYRIPYFIQIICKYCARYAYHTGRSVIGFPEAETVVQFLTGEIPGNKEDVIQRLPRGVFMNNLQADTDPIEYQVLLSTICHLTPSPLYPRLISLPEIQELWYQHGVDGLQSKLAIAIEELLDREVLIAGEDEGLPAYRISVDLFRRWWAKEPRVLALDIDKLK